MQQPYSLELKIHTGYSAILEPFNIVSANMNTIPFGIPKLQQKCKPRGWGTGYGEWDTRYGVLSLSDVLHYVPLSACCK